MSKPLIAILGLSGAGKSTLSHKLERKYGYTSIRSYTTRKPRENDETDLITHTFITPEEVEQYRDSIIASNYINDTFYFVTQNQLDCGDIYVVEENGLRDIRNHYHNKKIISIYLDVDLSITAHRLANRGDGDEAILKRMQYESEAFKNTKACCDFVCDNSTQDNCNRICEFINMLMEYNND